MIKGPHFILKKVLFVLIVISEQFNLNGALLIYK